MKSFFKSGEETPLVGEERVLIQEKFAQLDPLVREKKVLIVTHNNPDPDAIAAAWAFGFLLKRKFQANSVLAYGGMITRAENRAMVQLLHIPLKPVEKVDFRRFGTIALIDTQPGSKNYSLPESVRTSVVIDHHAPHRGTPRVDFADIRPLYGATSTIVAEYLIHANLAVDKRVATALYYGIRSDTLDLGRQATEADFKVAIALHPHVQLRIVSKITHPGLSRDYVIDFDRALHEARIYGDVILADLGYLKNTDMVALMADFFLQFANTRWSLVLARDGSHLVFSLRTKRRGQNAGRMAQRLVKGRGAAGGHGQIAGGQIPLGEPSLEKEEALSAFLTKRFLKMVGREGAQEGRLLPAI